MDKRFSSMIDWLSFPTVKLFSPTEITFNLGSVFLFVNKLVPHEAVKNKTKTILLRYLSCNSTDSSESDGRLSLKKTKERERIKKAFRNFLDFENQFLHL